MLLERSGEIADAAGGKSKNVSGTKKEDGGLRGKILIVMVRAVAAVRVVAAELHPGSKVDPHAATSCKETGHKWFKCSKRVCSVCSETGHDPNSCPHVVKEDANVAISDGDKLSTGDELDGMYVRMPPITVRPGRLLLRLWRQVV